MSTEMTNDITADDIIIDPEFESLLPYSDNTEDALLLQSIDATDGPTDPLVLWGDSNILIDGHRRLKIIKQYDFPFKVVREQIESRDAVKVWMLFKQLSRRNLRDHSKGKLIRELYDRIRGKHKKRDGNAAEKIAQVVGTTKRSVYRHLETQRIIDKLIPGWQVQAERIGLSKTVAAEVAKCSVSDQEMLLEEIIGVSDGPASSNAVLTKLRDSLEIKPVKHEVLPYNVDLPEGVEVGEFNDSTDRRGKATKAKVMAKIAEARDSYNRTKRLAEELTGKHYMDSGVMRHRMLTNLSRVGACLRFLAESTNKKSGE